MTGLTTVPSFEGVQHTPWSSKVVLIIIYVNELDSMWSYYIGFDTPADKEYTYSTNGLRKTLESLYKW